AGAKLHRTLGETLCRIRDSGPKPGKNPKNDGESDAPNDRRFPCRTNAPFVLRLRIMNGPDVVFWIPTDGWSFHDPGNSVGSPNPVFQSTAVVKSIPFYRVIVSPGVSG